MAISFPDLPKEAEIEARLIDFGATLTPSLGGPVQQVGRLGSRYAVDVELPALSEACARAWIARRIKAKTESQTLRLVWPQAATEAMPVTAVVDGAGQGGAVLAVRGLPAGQVLRELTFFSFISGGRSWLHATTSEVTASGLGTAFLPIGPMLRPSLADGLALNFAEPIIEGFLDGNAVEWSLKRLRLHGARFTLIENE